MKKCEFEVEKVLFFMKRTHSCLKKLSDLNFSYMEDHIKNWIDLIEEDVDDYKDKKIVIEIRK